MTHPMRLSRRRFFEQALASLTAMAAVAGTSRKAHAVGAPQRKHLINIMTWGGVDSLFWHNAIPSSEVDGISRTANGAIVTSNNGKLSFVNPKDILEKFDNIPDADRSSVTWDIRYPDFNPANPAELYVRPHPLSSGNYIGPGMSGFTSDDLSSMLIWRGIKGEGGHYIGNRIIQTGTTGDQTSCFSAIVAARLAQDYVRPLHYAQLANSSNDMFNQVGPLVGPAAPIQIPDFTTWKYMTVPDASDLALTRRSYLNDALTQLCTTAVNSSFKLQKSKDIFAGFLNSYNGAGSISTSNSATSTEFQGIWDQYRAAIKAEYDSHLFRTWFPRSLPIMNLTGEWAPLIDSMAFRFALAEYLVKKDLAAVVDLPSLGLDFHQKIDDECAVVLAIYTCYRTLIRNLKNTDVGGGQSLLSITTIVMHTEFDRSPQLYGQAGILNRSGTGHWEPTTSVLIAGMGVKGGKVVGDFKRGPNGKYSDILFPTQAGFGPYLWLPVNPTDGSVSSGSGTRTTTVRTIFPTLLSIFGANSMTQFASPESPFAAALS